MTVKYINGMKNINNALGNNDDIVDSKVALSKSVLNIFNNLAARTEATEDIIKGFSDILLQRIMDTPEKFGNNMLIDAITALSAANNANATVLTTTLSPQKTGESVINVILQNNLGIVSPNNCNGNLNVINPDNVGKLNHVNEVYELANQVIQIDNKEKQKQEASQIINDVNQGIKKDE